MHAERNNVRIRLYMKKGKGKGGKDRKDRSGKSDRCGPVDTSMRKLSWEFLHLCTESFGYFDSYARKSQEEGVRDTFIWLH